MDTVTVQISRENFEFLRDLACEMRKQDNRATAPPYFFAQRVRRDYPTTGDHGVDGLWYSFDGECYNSMAELLDNHPDASEDQVEEIYYKSHMEVENVFLTERACKEYTKLNKHNLAHPDDYLYHAYRNPELKSLFKAIAEFEQPVVMIPCTEEDIVEE
jgi:hypothetical protein